ncbi:MAG TPA: DNA ligase D [Pseudomonas sp.]|jgi:bifunctional non-homologous end joining protein LigD|uniref:DNA ligase D n=1 Tax=Pseudomonas sp. TaxID=306 RepID=UPI002ED7FD8A
MAKPVSEYARKRNFDITSEPAESPARGNSKEKGKNAAKALSFVIHKHDARNLHYDFRLELGGTLKSWAVPKGPSLDPANKRLAVQVEDHPLGYASFEGSIPEGQYGAGDVIVWDRGIWQPYGDPFDTYKQGKLKFTLVGEKLTGDWTLVRTRLKGSSDKPQWLLIKEKDQVARSGDEYDIVRDQPQSVVSGALVGKEKASAQPARAKRKTSVAAPAKSASKPTAAKKAAAIPEKLTPQLATLVDAPPDGDWLYEVKFDGYRILTQILDGEVRLFSRNGNDWTERLPLQAKALAALGLGDSWLDGEMVLLNEQGLSDFQALQNAFELGRSKDIVYYLFDVPFLGGQDLCDMPVEERRAALKQLLSKQRSKLLRFSDAFRSAHKDIVESASAMGLEGVIGKRPGSAYVSKRSPDWIKLKCRLRQEFVIVGYTQPQGRRSDFGAILLAVNEEGATPGLVYAGKVGTGFNQSTLKQLGERMIQLERSSSPLAKKLTSAQGRGVHWIEPELVCEAEFAEWTREGIVRQAAFVGLRTDKSASQVIHEHPRAATELKGAFKPKAAKATGESAAKPGKSAKNRIDVAGVSISHPDRVIDAESGTHKVDLAHYYETVADWILPHLKNRPVALLRCPEGVEGEQFFQKHAERLKIPNIKQLKPGLDPGHARLMEIDTVQALVGAAQMGTIELHRWGATSDRIETPDHIVLDLDPDDKLPWRSIIEATQMTMSVLDELGLEAFIKTSGGKGMHIIVPLARQADWDTVKTFAKAIAEFISQQLPERFTATMGPKNRVGKVFIDYLRNTRGASTVVAYSARARPGLPVSVPVARDELEGLTSARQWNVSNLQERLSTLKSDPWAGYQNRQRITKKMWAQLGHKP